MPIPLFRPVISEEAILAAGEVLRSGWIGLGPTTARFEHAFADYVGAGFCVGLSSCTAALHLALKLLDLPPGAEVITTPITFVSTNHAILYEGLKPVFADIQRHTGNIEPASVEARITEQTGAIIVVHYGGYPCDLDSLYDISRRHSIPLIEDCAHAAGAVYKGRRIGSHGQLHAFSFHAVKNLSMGSGGALTTGSQEYDARLRSLRWMGIDKDTFSRSDAGSRVYSWNYDVSELGYKYHLNDVEAAIGLAQLALLDEQNKRRRAIAELYDSELSRVAGLELLQYRSDRTSSRHLYAVVAERRDDLVDKLAASGIGAGVHYRRNDDYPMYERAELPDAQWFAERTISLPMHLLLTDDDVHRICSVIRGGW